MRIKISLLTLCSIVLALFTQPVFAQDNYFKCGKKQYALSDVGSISEESARDILQRVKLVYERPDSDDADMVDPAWSRLGTYYRGECYDEILYYALMIKVNSEAAWLRAPDAPSEYREYYYGRLVSVSKDWKHDMEERGVTRKTQMAVVRVSYSSPKGSYTVTMPIALWEYARMWDDDKWNQKGREELDEFLPEARDEALDVIFSKIGRDFERFVKETDHERVCSEGAI